MIVWEHRDSCHNSGTTTAIWIGLHNAIFEVHRFPMFLPAPLMGTGWLIYLLLPSTRKMVEAWNAQA